MGFKFSAIESIYPEAGELMIEPMLVWKLPQGKEHKLAEVCGNGEYFLEEKIDGAFYQFVRTENYSYLFGRSASVKTKLLTEKGANVPHIMDALSCLPPKTIIIGEIYVPNGTSKNVVSIMGCLPEEAIKRQKDNPIHYYLHDIIYFNGENLMNKGAEERYLTLQDIWNRYGLAQYDFLRLAKKVDTDLESEISRILAAGGEGAVLKKKIAPYTPSKRPAWATIKIKQMDSVDLVCMGFVPATKEYTGKELETWPYWESYVGKYQNEDIYIKADTSQYGKEEWYPITKYYFNGWNTAIKIGAYNDDGRLVELGTVSSGLTDEDKKDISLNPDKYLYKVCALDCMSLDKKEHTLRHPVFKEWRFDKNAQDCKICEIF